MDGRVIKNMDYSIMAKPFYSDATARRVKSRSGLHHCMITLQSFILDNPPGLKKIPIFFFLLHRLHDNNYLQQLTKLHLSLLHA